MRVAKKWKNLGFYVYALLDNRYPEKSILNGIELDYRPFYIGKGSNDRVLCHYRKITGTKEDYLKYQKNRLKGEIIWKLIRELNYPPTYVILGSNLTEEDALNLEIQLIQELGRRDSNSGNLSNFTDGGEGFYHPNEDQRKKWSKERTGEGNTFFGRKHTQETKDKISRTRKGTPAWNKGIPRTEEEKSKMRKSHLSTRGDNNPSKRLEVRKKLSEGKLKEKNPNSKEWKILDSETGEIFTFRGGIKSWCLEKGITYMKLQSKSCRYKIL